MWVLWLGTGKEKHLRLSRPLVCMRIIILLIILLAVSLPSVWAAEAQCNQEKLVAENYVLEGENMSVWGEVHIDSRKLCVFSFSDTKGHISDIVIIQDSNRLEDKNSITKTSFSVHTKNFLDKEYQNMQVALDTSYDEFRLAKAEYETNFDSIKAMINQISKFLDVCIDVVPTVKICASDELKNLVVTKLFGGLDWEKTIANFQNLRGNTLELSSDNIVYFDEIEGFYEKSLAVQAFFFAIDSKTGLTLSQNLAPYNFSQIGKEKLQIAKSESSLIGARVVARKEESLNRSKALNEHIALAKNEMSNSITNGKSIEDQKFKFCTLNKPSGTLLEDERFKEYDTAIDNSHSTLREIEQTLNTTEKRDSGPLHLFKIKWKFESWFWRLSWERVKK